MATSKKAAASKKECTIVAVYKFKTNKKLNGTRCALVRNGEGTEHKVWTHANGLKPHCDCEGFEKSHGRRRCYHITTVLAREEARKAAVATPATPVVAQPEVTAQPVIETAATETSSDLVERAAARAAKPGKGLDPLLATSEAESQRRASAPLNGNQGFSLLKKAS